MKDNLGDRMKSYYEDRTRFCLPRRTYTIVRIDGKAFHTYTKGLVRPFDMNLIADMDATACYLCKNIQGAKFGFVQSDEISILLTDFDELSTDAWFDGNIQKMVSIAASTVTSKFNQLRTIRFINDKYEKGITNITELWFENLIKEKLANFDTRVFTLPTKSEVENYFIWRQQDTVRNSISSVAQSLYSHKELEGKTGDQKQEMIFQKGINWNDYDPKLKRGRFINKEAIEKETSFVSNDKIQQNYTRNIWTSIECPIFTQEREFLTSKILNNN